MKELRLLYDMPASDWNEALPLGNGRLGAMFFGGANREILQLNEDSLWYGAFVDRNNPECLPHLAEIRELIQKGEISKAERLMTFAMSGLPQSQRPYQSAGQLEILFDHGEASEYRRELDINQAVAKAAYSADGVRYTREALVSVPAQVVAVHITADRAGAISFSALLTRERFYDRSFAADGRTVVMTGGTSGGVEFCVALRGVASGGKLYAMGEHLVAENADEGTLLVAIATSFYEKDCLSACLRTLDAAEEKPFTELKEEHIASYRALFDRVSLELGPGPVDVRTIPERLQALEEGAQDNALMALYFQFGRYLLISSSYPGTQPANLQGIWNRDMKPPWDSKYTININTEMNYWMAESCSLPECHEPLFDLIVRMLPNGRHTARVMYGCGGFVAHHNTDIWGDTAPQDIYLPATYWPMGAAWLCLHLWEHYDYNRDRDFLAWAYPILKEAAAFFVDFLVRDERGYWVTCPSVSPENTYILPDGTTGRVCAGPSMDSQILTDLFSCVIEAASLLGMDEDFARKVRLLRDGLPPISVGIYGQIMEWSRDYEEQEPGHRHISQLFALYPSWQITPQDTPELAQAARVTLERRLRNGGGHTGWSRAWIINMWARLQDSAQAYENLRLLLTHSTLPNLLDYHPPFQIDGNFGGTAGISNMLVQSGPRETLLLPALPEQWPQGHICGIRIRGGAMLDLRWREGILDSCRLVAGIDFNGVLRYQKHKAVVALSRGQCIEFNAELTACGCFDSDEQRRNH